MTPLVAERSRAYANFAAAFAYPGAETLEAIRSGDLADFFRLLLSGIDATFVSDVDWRALRGEGADLDGLQEEFTRLFDAGDSGPLCPLHESHYRGSELETFEELVRYYDFFGLSLPEDRQVRPDHLATQLEFLHYLSFREAQSSGDQDSTASLVRAQRDFIGRHTGAWVPMLASALAGQGATPFFPELTRLLERFLQAEWLRLNEQANET